VGPQSADRPRVTVAGPEVTPADTDRTRTHDARDATGDQQERYWDRVRRVSVGFDAHRRRTDESFVVVLMPADEERADAR
jgi:hypothetical protein